MEVPSGKVFEVLVRNPRGVAKIADIALTLTVREVVIQSGVLVFEGVRVDVSDSGAVDHVTFARTGTAIEGLEILANTYGAFRACPSRESPTTEPRGSFSLFKPGGVRFATFSYPWAGKPVKEVDGWSKGTNIYGDPCEAYSDGIFNVTYETKIHQAQFPDVLVVGSGPLGATYARKIVEAGHGVLMVEMGAQETEVIGRHKKNTLAFQRDIDSFVHVIQGDLSTLSVPVVERHMTTMSPISVNIGKSFTRNGQNPDQRDFDNLGGAAATRSVGGMSAHWTCATPFQHKELERSDIFDDKKWNELYAEAVEYLRTSRTQFDDSIRHQLVKDKLTLALAEMFPGKNREILSLPLACKRSESNPDFVEWTATDTILGETVESPRFRLLSSHQCTKVLHDPDTGKIIAATIKGLMDKTRIYVFAKKYVICGGSVLTPQILFNSGFRPVEGSIPALGHYLTEQTMTFCQVILKKEFVDEVSNSEDPRWKHKVAAHRAKHPEDPLPFPYNDPDPQITVPVHVDFPWHTQIHRDAFSYGDVAEYLDSRLVVDFRFFGMVEPVESNCVKFSTKIRDHFHMPQPTFHFVLGEKDTEDSHKMMEDMAAMALRIGGYLPGAEPQFMAPGLALHICGTTRAGKDTERAKSVVDRYSKVWGIDNLWLGGNGVIPTKNACNPTITSMCFAIEGADKLIAELNTK